MTLEQYWLIVIKRWHIILICFLVVGLGALIGSKLMKPVYQSSALVQVVIHSNSNNQSNYNDLMASDQLVQTEATLATSDPVLREVAAHYPGITVSQLEKEVSATTRLNTQLFEIDVVDSSPERAATLANAITNTLINQQQAQLKADNLQAQGQINGNLTQVSQKINDTIAKIASLQAKGGNQSEIAIQQMTLSGLQQQYSQWQSALAQLALAQAQDGNPLQVEQPAQPATSPVRPNILLNTAAGLVVGLLLGILLAMVFQQLDTRLRTPEALAEALGWPTLATIRLGKSSNREDVINPDGRNTNAEAYRILRTNIGFVGIDNPLHSLMVTSAVPREGKSVVAANLAIFMARAGKQTLLIDADLRRPMQHTQFNLPADSMGLSNAILAFSAPNINVAKIPPQPHKPTLQPLDAGSSGRLALGPFVHTVGIPNLWVMPCGPVPPNPPELLESKAMHRFLSMLEDCGVEIVIFDAPPIVGLSDASILASKVDAAICVVDMTRAKRGKARQLKGVLKQTGVHVLGAVANKHRGNDRDSVYPYYYYEETEEPEGGEKQNSNGYASSAQGAVASPLSPLPPPFEQGKRSG